MEAPAASFLFSPLVFGLGFLLALARLACLQPDSRESPPRAKLVVRGSVSRVQGLPDHRYRVMCGDARYLTVSGWNQLPGGLILTLEAPTYVPLCGQTFEARVRIRPVRGMANPGVFRIEDYWARQGMYWRGYLSGYDLQAVVWE